MTLLRNPLTWLLLLLAPGGLLLCSLWAWAALDRTVPLQYVSIGTIGLDATTRVLSLRWLVHRNKYCPGNVYRIVQAEFGGTVYLSTIGIDINADTPQQQIERIGKTYIGRETFVEIPKSVGGRIELRNRVESWCNPMQEWWPIVIESPVVTFSLPKPG